MAFFSLPFFYILFFHSISRLYVYCLATPLASIPTRNYYDSRTPYQPARVESRRPRLYSLSTHVATNAANVEIITNAKCEDNSSYQHLRCTTPQIHRLRHQCSKKNYTARDFQLRSLHDSTLSCPHMPHGTQARTRTLRQIGSLIFTGRITQNKHRALFVSHSCII